MSEYLYFKNSVFHEGINYTVRLGSKWFGQVKIGDKVFVLPVGAVPEASAEPKTTIIDNIFIPFRDIPPFVLEYEHDPACRTIAGLNEAMRKVYPSWDGDPNTLVTCLGFVIK